MIHQHPLNNEQNLSNLDTGTSFDGADNFIRARDISANFKSRVVFPSGEKVRVINPNAKPIKLNPPK